MSISHIVSMKPQGVGKGNSDLSIVLPCAGISRRLKVMTAKALIPLGGGECLVERQVSLLKLAYPLAEIIVVVGYMADEVIATLPAGVKVVENERYEDTNIARSIGMAMRLITNHNMLLVYGDLLYDFDSINNLTNGESFIGTTIRQKKDDIGVVSDEHNYVNNISYMGDKVTITPKKWAQICFCKNPELEKLRKVACYRQHERLFGFEIINRAINMGAKFEARQMNKSIFEINTHADMRQAKLL